MASIYNASRSLLTRCRLAALALRNLHTPANSVPSERAFSVMNILRNKTRNRLSAERAAKLTFIYINSRVLTQKAPSAAIKAKQTWLQIAEDVDQELQLEDDYLPPDNTTLGKRKRDTGESASDSDLEEEPTIATSASSFIETVIV